QIQAANARRTIPMNSGLGMALFAEASRDAQDFRRCGPVDGDRGIDDRRRGRARIFHETGSRTLAARGNEIHNS
ncbi:MAG TPA: hypothetical protein VLN59_10245, partial [Burkholderiales bacterium]|nr:hypothetical protein [Burkholderiales bacterium]